MTTLITTSLQNEIDDFTQRHITFKQKWLEKQRNISDLLTSTAITCRKHTDEICPSHDQQQNFSSNNITDPSFQHSFIDYLKKHTPVTITTLAQIFSKDDEQISQLIQLLKLKLAADGQTVLPLLATSLSSNGDSSKLSSFTSVKRSNLSWLGLPKRRGSLSNRERPSRELVHLLSHLTVGEFEREKFHADMDQLLNRPTAMEKMHANRYQTSETIQEYCQYTTREDCPLANPHSRRHSRSSSISSDHDQPTTDDDSQMKKKRKRDDSFEFNERNKRSSRYYRNNGRDYGTCGKVHFRRSIKPHTDESLGDCSFLNTCFHTVKIHRNQLPCLLIILGNV